MFLISGIRPLLLLNRYQKTHFQNYWWWLVLKLTMVVALLIISWISRQDHWVVSLPILQVVQKKGDYGTTWQTMSVFLRRRMSRKQFGNFSPKHNYNCESVTVSISFSAWTSNVIKGRQAGEAVPQMSFYQKILFFCFRHKLRGMTIEFELVDRILYQLLSTQKCVLWSVWSNHFLPVNVLVWYQRLQVVGDNNPSLSL